MPVEALGAVLRAFGAPHSLETVYVRDPLPGEVRVRIVAAGVCHSDVGQADGEWEMALPAILGHEGAGVVMELGPGVANVAVGDHVVLNGAPGCGMCRHCLAGHPILCQRSLAAMADGRLTTGPSPLSDASGPIATYALLSCFAEQVVVASESVIPIPDDVPAEVAALLGCAVITGVGAAIETLRIEAGSRGAVIGAGGVGVNAIMGARLAGAVEVVAIDPSQFRRQTALSFGATDTLDSNDVGALEELRRDAANHGFDWTLIASGQKDAITLGIETLRPGGTACVIGLAPQASPVPVDMLDLVVYERKIVGSAYGTIAARLLVPRLIALYQSGALPLGELISDRYELSDIDEAFERARAAEGLRSVLQISDDGQFKY